MLPAPKPPVSATLVANVCRIRMTVLLMNIADGQTKVATDFIEAGL